MRHSLYSRAIYYNINNQSLDPSAVKMAAFFICFLEGRRWQAAESHSCLHFIHRELCGWGGLLLASAQGIVMSAAMAPEALTDQMYSKMAAAIVLGA